MNHYVLAQDCAQLALLARQFSESQGSSGTSDRYADRQKRRMRQLVADIAEELGGTMEEVYKVLEPPQKQ